MLRTQHSEDVLYGRGNHYVVQADLGVMDSNKPASTFLDGIMGACHNACIKLSFFLFVCFHLFVLVLTRNHTQKFVQTRQELYNELYNQPLNSHSLVFLCLAFLQYPGIFLSLIKPISSTGLPSVTARPLYTSVATSMTTVVELSFRPGVQTMPTPTLLTACTVYHAPSPLSSPGPVEMDRNEIRICNVSSYTRQGDTLPENKEKHWVRYLWLKFLAIVGEFQKKLN